MTRRVSLCTATYRTFEFVYGVGLIDMFAVALPPDLRKRLDALDVEIVPGTSRGYGAGRNYGQLLAAACGNGSELALTIDSDIAWRAEHVIQLLEAEKLLRAHHQGPVVVGGVYPESGRPDMITLFELTADGRRMKAEDQNLSELACRLEHATKLAKRGVVDEAQRYAPSWLIPLGFALWPLEVYREKIWTIEDRSSASEVRYFDNAMSEHALAAGVPIYADLGLDIGHMPIRPVTALEQAKLYAAMLKWRD